ncbi:uncharacterized protein LOC124894174, partial [Capsicum annuum]|uniref:uncharacterized protein LOC124894174 n=1 Tax=Capsicum annuum TaxID=4072 RepID=UPI001FB1654D
MNPAKFTGTKVEEDPQEFVNEMEKIFKVIHVDQIEGVELAAYQLKDVANQWFYPLELRKAKAEEFINLKQGKRAGVEEKKKKIAEAMEKKKQAKRAKSADQGQSQQQSGNWGNKWQKKKFCGKAQSAASALAPRPPPSYFQRDFSSARRNIGCVISQANFSAPPPTQKGATSAVGSGRNRLYALTNLQEEEALPYVVV